MSTVIASCTCKNTYQDKHYGTNLRVHNTTAKGTDKQLNARCTVCGAVHTVNKGA